MLRGRWGLMMLRIYPPVLNQWWNKRFEKSVDSTTMAMSLKAIFQLLLHSMYCCVLKDNMLSDKTMTCDPYFLSFQVQESINKVTKPYYSGCQSTYTISALLEWGRSSTQPMYFCLIRQKWIRSISARRSDFSFLIVCLPTRMNDCLCCWQNGDNMEEDESDSGSFAIVSRSLSQSQL